MLPDILIEPIIRAALAEDLGRAGDVTVQACIDADARMTTHFTARKPGAMQARCGQMPSALRFSATNGRWWWM